MKQIIYIYVNTYEHAKRLFNVLFKPSVDKEVLCNKEVWENDGFLQIETMWEVWRIVNNPQPKTGHWVDIDEEPHEVWECDHCGFVIDGSGCIDPYDYRDTYKFCPNCGCRMVEPQERSE